MNSQLPRCLRRTSRCWSRPRPLWRWPPWSGCIGEGSHPWRSHLRTKLGCLFHSDLRLYKLSLLFVTLQAFPLGIPWGAPKERGDVVGGCNRACPLRKVFKLIKQGTHLRLQHDWPSPLVLFYFKKTLQ